MGILKGPLTVRRYRVVGELSDGWRERFRERLQALAFKEPVGGVKKEEVTGWVQVHNLLDTDFEDFNRWLYNSYATFALRVDKKTLPAKLFGATLQKKCEAWCKERDVTRCPSSVKTELKEQLELDWLKKALPSVSVTEISWNVTDGYLICHSLSTRIGERLPSLFFRTFGLRLVPWSPLDWLDDVELREGLMSTTPTMEVS
jgi:DNA recombination-dependent growth factor C